MVDAGLFDTYVIQGSEYSYDGQSNKSVGQGTQFNKISKIVGRDNRQTSGRTCPDDEKLSPTEHEPRKRAEHTAYVDVFAARGWKTCPELGIDQPADEHKNTDKDPEKDDGIEVTQIASDNLRRREDAGPDGDADQDGHAIRDAEDTAEFWLDGLRKHP